MVVCGHSLLACSSLSSYVDKRRRIGSARAARESPCAGLVAVAITSAAGCLAFVLISCFLFLASSVVSLISLFIL